MTYTPQLWHCIQQRAGPLVKECRYQRPRLYKTDDPNVRREKNKIIHLLHDSLFRRTRVDRLELYLGLMGHHASVYGLTFSDAFLPPDFEGVRRVWRNFLGALRRWKKQPFDYVYLIEGRHGDHRYHIHLVLRDDDFTPADVRFLWGGGPIWNVDPLILSNQDCFFRTAKYFCKESTDGVILPIGCRTWVVSQSLYRKLPSPEKFISQSGIIPVPPDAGWQEEDAKVNQWGKYRYAAYITDQK